MRSATPAEAEGFVREAMRVLPKASTLVPDALGFVADDAFARLVPQAMAQLTELATQREPQALNALPAAAVMAAASLQAPELLAPWRAQLLEWGIDLEAPMADLGAPAHHLLFEPGYLVDDGPSWLRKTLHPTWRLPTCTDASPLGGTWLVGGWATSTCHACGQALHHLLSLPSRLVFASLPAGEGWQCGWQGGSE